MGRDQPLPPTGDSRKKFQSTRPRGARLQVALKINHNSSFNPRAHVGRDAALALADGARTAVSIHAPTWGATTPVFLWCQPTLFQSTRPRGARQRMTKFLPGWLQFQSTRPRGARRRSTASKGMGVRFQSTRPRGARRGRFAALEPDQPFQSTRPRGARPRNRT